MKKQKRKIILFVIVILIFCIFLFQSRKNNKFQDELIFFKVFSSGYGEVKENTLKSENQTNQPYQQYVFQVSYKNINFKNVYLTDTINKTTKIREKIAPRNQRNF